MTPPKEWLTRREVAELLSCSERTVDRLVAAGVLRRSRLTRKKTLFDRAHVNAVVESRKRS